MAENPAPVGPLGMGHKPVNDPLKGLRGVMAGAMGMESITFYLVLTVILRVDNGAYWTTFNWVSVVVVATAMLVMSFLQGKTWAIPVNIGLQVLGILGFFIHPSMGIIGIFFALVWWYILHLRKNLLERMKRGLLTTQHL
ncbi:DUF4233 domain-containing protein [Corynebacterium sp. ES2794-CONJ1]|uniref:DUF4233 domain-containing protein n=1 Tax=unclassified Corynebacterium TaxID=2624378 RepID=UPI00216729A2|nr:MULTISPECIES: DUF4233 domain-containing protein [unclassified Corynebacterium]MCS4490698.1 DUF4233 domain-containing protein [Corynebacterium sp. ES2775-CONJ]MCS4492500.1 DUF4233 domain-containing protein [Corynebacterium sp. ES2715-CONJ3]MCS4532536.1 DUF4233 domain-containing protein [Corynebacterium sp. ES2730-CONJ]MCU9519931.1 DUF4233 domain-containing protein [Corynebacterium sp. ES2794-CONJ1]